MIKGGERGREGGWEIEGGNDKGRGKREGRRVGDREDRGRGGREEGGG